MFHYGAIFSKKFLVYQLLEFVGFHEIFKYPAHILDTFVIGQRYSVIWQRCHFRTHIKFQMWHQFDHGDMRLPA